MARSGPEVAAVVPPARPAAEMGLGAGYMWVVLFASTLVQTTASIGSQAISPLAPFLLPDLQLSKTELGLVSTAFFTGAVVMLTPAGWVSDRLGVRRMFLVGLLGCGLPLVLAAQAPTLPLLMGAMLLSGLGNAIALPSTTRAIIYWFPLRRRGLAMGVKQTGVALAGTLMGLIAPQLAAPLGWRGALSAIAWFTVAAGLASWLLYREHPDAHAGQATNRAAGTSMGSLLRNRDLVLLSVTSLFLAAVQLSLVGFMVVFLTERLGYSAAVAGGLLALAQAGGVVGRIAWGIISDTVFGGRRRVVMMIIAGGASACAFALALVGPGFPEPLLWLLLVCSGLSAIGWNGVNMTFVGELAGRGASATAAGLNLTGSYLGIIFGPPLFGLLVDTTRSYVPAFVAAGCLSLVALLLLTQIKVRHQPA